MPWLALYAVATVNRRRRGADGRTAYERQFGEKWSQPMIRLAECVLWLPPGKRSSRLNSGIKYGICLGIRDASGEHYIGTAVGVFLARTMRRLFTRVAYKYRVVSQGAWHAVGS